MFRLSIKQGFIRFLRAFVDLDIALIGGIAAAIIALGTIVLMGEGINIQFWFFILFVGTVFSIVVVVLVHLFIKSFFGLLLHVVSVPLPLDYTRLSCLADDTGAQNNVLALVVRNDEEYHDCENLTVRLYSISWSGISEREERDLYRRLSNTGFPSFSWDSGKTHETVKRRDQRGLHLALADLNGFFFNLTNQDGESVNIPRLYSGHYQIRLHHDGEKVSGKKTTGDALVSFDYDEERGFSNITIDDNFYPHRARKQHTGMYWRTLLYG